MAAQKLDQLRTEFTTWESLSRSADLPACAWPLTDNGSEAGILIGALPSAQSREPGCLATGTAAPRLGTCPEPAWTLPLIRNSAHARPDLR